MKKIINGSDLSLSLQKIIDLSIKIEIYNDNGTVLGMIQSNIVEGSFDIDSESDVRRTCSVRLIPEAGKSIVSNPDGYIWANKCARIFLGIRNNRTNQYVWYSQGFYYFTSSSAVYDSATNTLSISACDPVIKLNGTKSGVIGSAVRTTIPAYETDESTGEITRHHTIREAMISILTQLGYLNQYIIEDMGEQNALEQVNPNWRTYRKEHPLWNTIPYDLEFSTGSTVFQLISTLRDLYPDYESFFDTDGTFICQRIPDCDEDDIIFDNAFLQKILISEDCTLDYTSVKNVCEIWGKIIETDYFADSSSYTDHIYSCAIEGYQKYAVGDIIAIAINAENEKITSIKINDLDAIPVYAESKDEYIAAKSLVPNKIYTFKIAKILVEEKPVVISYLLGEWQPHAVTALVDGTENTEEYVMSDGRITSKYSIDYFKDKYNCDTVSLTKIPNSPFTVQKLGELLTTRSGDVYENITSNALALERAEYENWKTTRLTDTVTIKTKIVPFADVNLKCSYKRSDMSCIFPYVVKSVSHDFSGGTTTWTMYRYYPSRKNILENAGMHKTLADYPQSVLGTYTQEELTRFWEGAVYS